MEQIKLGDLTSQLKTIPMKKTFVFFFLAGLCVIAFGQWTDVSTGKIRSARLCYALNADTCVITGDNGMLYRTADRGLTFDSVQTAFSASWFNDIEFTSSSTGYVVGGTAFGFHSNTLAKTTDGGITWDSLSANVFPGYNFLKLSFVNDQVGFIVGEQGLMVKTLDGGQTLTQISAPIPPTAGIGDIYFTDVNTGFIAASFTASNGVAQYQVLRTADQGATWNVVYTDSLANRTVLNDRPITSLEFTDAMNGLAARGSGFMLKTADGGNSWTSSYLVGDTTYFFQVTYSTPQHAYACTRYAYGGWARDFFSTSDGGNTWVSQPFQFEMISMSSQDNGYAIVEGSLYVTTSGGLNVEDDLGQQFLQVYPNPTADYVWIELELGLTQPEVSFYTLEGKKVLQTSVEVGRQRIELGDLAAGMYVLVLESAGQPVHAEKIVIQEGR